MEYGGPLDLYKRLVIRDVDERGYLSAKKVAAILSQSMAALCHLHLQCKFVHRDVKPENLVVSEGRQDVIIKLTDFDTIALAETGTMARGRMGTFPFMAPE